MSTTRDAALQMLPAKRARLAETLRLHSHRKILLGLESGVPEDVAWSLTRLLIASCPPENTSIIDRSVQPLGRDVLTDSVSLPRNPHLLRTLLPVAVPPPQRSLECDATTALFPPAPGAALTRQLQTAQWRQAWLVLRNISLMAENEAPLAQSAMLRKLVLRTLRPAFRQFEHEPPLSAAELRELPGYDAVPEALPPAFDPLSLPQHIHDPSIGQCTLNPYCVRGFRHGGHGGLCRLPRDRHASYPALAATAPFPIVPPKGSAPAPPGAASRRRRPPAPTAASRRRRRAPSAASCPRR